MYKPLTPNSKTEFQCLDQSITSAKSLGTNTMTRDTQKVTCQDTEVRRTQSH